ncbi:MAG: MBL fold metallo-hydrolase [Planctomycetota bacterium]|jgi:phosphoribosyl 1,2-cyclic phosphate phosphodiesterase
MTSPAGTPAAAGSVAIPSANEIILLGTGTSSGVPVIGCDCETCRSPNPRNQRTRTGVAINTPQGTILIDTSPELRLQLVRERIAVAHAVLFTHGHADHLFGLDDTRLFAHRLGHALPVYCERFTEQNIRSAFHYAFRPPPPEAHKASIPQFDLRLIDDQSFEVIGQRIQPIRLFHGRLPVLGFRINNVAFCTDVSRIPEESFPLLSNLDVLILDALRDKPHPTHFSIDQALEVVARVRPKRTFLTHISHSLEHETTNARLPAGVKLAWDGLRLPF